MDVMLRRRLMSVLGVVAFAGLAAVAGPRVEITDVRLEDHARGIVGFTYEVGDLGDKAYNLTIKAGVTGQDPVIIQSQVNVAAGKYGDRPCGLWCFSMESDGFD